MRTWEEAFRILEPIPTDDYISGRWVPIRYHKCRALFELAREVPQGAHIVDLGTWRGLTAVALALGSRPDVVVHTLDDYETRRVEAVAGGGVTYHGVDYDKFLDNLNKLPPDVRERIVQHPLEIREAAAQWRSSVGLVFWDLWGERLIDDVKAWAPHVVPGGLIVMKVFEDGRLHHERLYSLPGFRRYKDFPEGVIYTLIRDGARYLDSRWGAVLERSADERGEREAEYAGAGPVNLPAGNKGASRVVFGANPVTR